MGKAIMFAAVSLDGFVAADDDTVGPLFDWYENGDVAGTFSDQDRVFHTTQETADFLYALAPDMAACVIGRRLFDLTDGWNGVPANGEHVFVVTHEPPTDWAYRDTAPFTFVTDGVRERDRAGEGVRRRPRRRGQRRSDGGQALREGLIDQVVLNLVPAVLGSGRPFFGDRRHGRPGAVRRPPRSCRASRSPTWSTTSGDDAAASRCCSSSAACRQLQADRLPCLSVTWPRCVLRLGQAARHLHRPVSPRRAGSRPGAGRPRSRWPCRRSAAPAPRPARRRGSPGTGGARTRRDRLLHVLADVHLVRRVEHLLTAMYCTPGHRGSVRSGKIHSLPASATASSTLCPSARWSAEFTYAGDIPGGVQVAP